MNGIQLLLLWIQLPLLWNIEAPDFLFSELLLWEVTPQLVYSIV